MRTCSTQKKIKENQLTFYTDFCSSYTSAKPGLQINEEIFTGIELSQDPYNVTTSMSHTIFGLFL